MTLLIRNRFQRPDDAPFYSPGIEPPCTAKSSCRVPSCKALLSFQTHRCYFEIPFACSFLFSCEQGDWSFIANVKHLVSRLKALARTCENLHLSPKSTTSTKVTVSKVNVSLYSPQRCKIVNLSRLVGFVLTARKKKGSAANFSKHRLQNVPEFTNQLRMKRRDRWDHDSFLQASALQQLPHLSIRFQISLDLYASAEPPNLSLPQPVSVDQHHFQC